MAGRRYIPTAVDDRRPIACRGQRGRVAAQHSFIFKGRPVISRHYDPKVMLSQSMRGCAAATTLGHGIFSDAD
jgi:hypothetical protein